tara:strand:+ start:808 stop:1608 length:801 start_codon:yes stop_codon:yes gene_type:complete
MNNSPIGIFDSGLGGLTVLQYLERKLPNESFIYFGDNARVPYGNKSEKTIINYSKQICKFLQKHNVKLIIIACNTSSALAINELKKQFKVPIFGVIEPAVLLAENYSFNSNTIVVLGTNATIKSKAYSKQFKKLGSTKNIIEKSCPLFVPIIEEGLISGEIAESIISYYLNNFIDANINQFILGCTHYPILKPALQKILGKKVKLTTSGEALIPTLITFMKYNKMFSKKNKIETSFFITDFPQKFYELGSQFFGKELNNIYLINSF